MNLPLLAILFLSVLLIFAVGGGMVGHRREFPLRRFDCGRLRREEGGALRIWGGGLILAGLLMTGCATTQHTGERGLSKTRGKASYYAGKYAGRPTANGEIFDPEALTAAHRSLPFDTRVRVTRIDVPEEPSVVVRINDRGPFKRGRIIDLSKAAARELRMIREGIVDVRLNVLSYPGEDPASPSESPRLAW